MLLWCAGVLCMARLDFLSGLLSGLLSSAVEKASDVAEILGHIALTKGTSKFLPTMGMKRFPVSHNIIHQVGYVTSFDNFSIVHKFTTLIPAHVGLMFDPLQNSLCFAFPFIGDEAKDFLLCVVWWDISRWRGSCAFQTIVVFQVALQYLVVVSHFILITEILPVQHSLHVLI